MWIITISIGSDKCQAILKLVCHFLKLFGSCFTALSDAGETDDAIFHNLSI